MSTIMLSKVLYASARLIALLACVATISLLVIAFTFEQFDVESFLRQTIGGWFRHDAFDELNRVALSLIWLSNVLTVCCLASICTKKYVYSIIVISGPLIAALFYMLSNGFSDPSWSTLASLCSIGIAVSVTIAMGVLLIQLIDSNKTRKRG